MCCCKLTSCDIIFKGQYLVEGGNLRNLSRSLFFFFISFKMIFRLRHRLTITCTSTALSLLDSCLISNYKVHVCESLRSIRKQYKVLHNQICKPYISSFETASTFSSKLLPLTSIMYQNNERIIHIKII